MKVDETNNDLKLLILYTSNESINFIKKFLYEHEVDRFSISDSFRHNMFELFIGTYRGIELEVDLKKDLRIEIYCSQLTLNCLCKKIKKFHQEGKINNAQYYVLPVMDYY